MIRRHYVNAKTPSGAAWREWLHYLRIVLGSLYGLMPLYLNHKGVAMPALVSGWRYWSVRVSLDKADWTSGG